MGRKQNQSDAREKALEKLKEEKKEEQKKEEEQEPEDTPLVKELKGFDDEYLAIEKDYEKEMQELEKKYSLLQAPLLEERTKALSRTVEGVTNTGTPACPKFWLTALQNHPAFEDIIDSWDEPVLEYLKDITKAVNYDQPPSTRKYSITFHFAENPYFTNTTLMKEYEVEQDSPYSDDVTVKEIKSTEIEWKAGKDVTVAPASGAKKGKAGKKVKSKNKLEPRKSFFRVFFRNLKDGDEPPEDLVALMEAEDEDDDEEDIMEYIMQNDEEIASCIKDQIIPFAVRWYTGEAAPSDDGESDDEDDDEDDEEEDDEDESSEEDSAPPAKNKKGGKAPAKKGGKASPELKPSEEPKKEECKQQ